MRERVEALVGPVARRMWVSTFHAACVRILRRDGIRLGYTGNFTIYDQADAVRLTGYVIRDLGLDAKKFPPRAIHALISTAKNELVDFETYSDRARTIMERRVAEVYREYQQRLLAANAMDFDDLLLVTVNLLQACPDVLEHYQRAVPARPGGRVPGHQPGPKRAGPAARRRPPPGARSSATATSRSTGGGAPTSATSCSSRRPSPTPPWWSWSRTTAPPRPSSTPPTPSSPTTPCASPRRCGPSRATGASVVRYHAEDEHDEGALAGRRGGPPPPAASGGRDRPDQAAPRTAATTGATSPSSTAPTPRAGPSRRSSSAGTSPTRWSAAPASTTGAEIKDLLAYLRAIANPADEVSLKRIVNVPKRGVGDTSVARLDRYARAHNVAFADAMAAARRPA